MSKALSELLGALKLQLKGVWSALLQEFSKLGEVAAQLVAVIKELKLHSLVEFLTDRLALLIFKVQGSDPGMEATRRANHILSDALTKEHQVIDLTLLVSVVTFAMFIVLPLTYKRFTRPRLGVFISFNNRSRGAIAEELKQCLEAKEMNVYHIPFRKDAVHDDINEQVYEGIIEKCDWLVCLPGSDESFVEKEVSTAIGARKLIALLISEHNGTLPNTTIKKYPMFRLERTSQHLFGPLSTFLSHIGGDLSSTWYLCKKALCDPFTFGLSGRALLFGGICFLLVWASCAFDVIIHGRNLTENLPVAAESKAPLILSQGVVLSLHASIVLPLGVYVCLFGRSLRRRFDAQRQARYSARAAHFKRDDWIGKIPDLDPGEPLYECLFDSAPSAHREMKEKEGQVTYDKGSHSYV